MTSSNVFIFLLLLFFITLAESEKKKSVDKIIIHVPYKIHKHHHTHTKYKVITIPAPKQESTVIYLKENEQNTKPEVQPHIQNIDESKLMPPHQQSAASLLHHLQNYKTKPEEEQQLSHFSSDQKPLESSNHNLLPTYEFQPMIISTNENVIPQFSLKPVLIPPQQMFTQKYVMDPAIHHQQDFIPSFNYQTVLHPTPQFIHSNTIKQNSKSQLLQDNVAHSASHEYKMILPRKSKSETYKVKEEVQEDFKGQLLNQHKISKIIVPSMKFNRKGKPSIHLGPKYGNRSPIKMVPTDPNFEYEHVGYLLIDGNTRKIVGKNFQDEIHLTR